jgi:hypothetical protein
MHRKSVVDRLNALDCTTFDHLADGYVGKTSVQRRKIDTFFRGCRIHPVHLVQPIVAIPYLNFVLGMEVVDFSLTKAGFGTVGLGVGRIPA